MRPGSGRATDDADAPLFRRIVADAQDAIVVQDMAARIEWVNPACERLYGWRLDELRGRKPQELILPAETRPAPTGIAGFRYDPDGGLFRRDHLGRHLGSTVWVQQSFALVDPGPDQADRKVVVTCRDVTDQVGRETTPQRRPDDPRIAAAHDDLTGLATRTRLAAHFATPPVRDAIRRGRLGVLLIDIDRFKDINDTRGQAAGDHVLRHVADLLAHAAEAAGPEELACRTGGDEFLLVCALQADDAALGARAALVQRALETPLAQHDRCLRVGASIGAARAGPEARSGEAMLRCADAALHEAKARGRGRSVTYTADLGRRQRARQTLARELHEAVRDEQFEIHLQPQLSLADGRIGGCEALIRWRHPRRGLLAPAAFLGAAEELGLMAEIDYRAMTLALDALQALGAAGFAGLTMSINVSAAILAELDYPGLLDWALQTRGLSPAQICIEMLETTILDGSGADVMHAVARLRQLGVRVALDDFGTGYAGLSHLACFEVDQVKLDRSMIARLDHDPRSRVIVRAIIRLCGLLHMSVVGEGVETDAQRAMLRRAGCPVIQGFGLARPMPPPALIDWLAARPAAETAPGARPAGTPDPIGRAR